MKRRIAGASHTGLGGGGASLINGVPSGEKKRDAMIKKCAKDAYGTFFKGTKLDYQYCDAGVHNGSIRLGVEPSYMYEELKMISIEPIKAHSSFTTGYAYGAWGTGIRRTRKFYGEYKRKSKFVRFIDRWHHVFFDSVDKCI